MSSGRAGLRHSHRVAGAVRVLAAVAALHGMLLPVPISLKGSVGRIEPASRELTYGKVQGHVLVLISSSILVCQFVRCLVQKRLGGLDFEAMMMHVELALLQSGSGSAG